VNPVQGRLRWTKKGTPLLHLTSAKGKETDRIPVRSALDRRLTPSPGTEVPVLMELKGDGSPAKVWPESAERWEGSSTATESQDPRPNPSPSPSPGHTRYQRRPQNSLVEVPRHSDFLNPYNFVPAPPRQRGDEELGDRDPRRSASHDRLHADRWTGRISCRLRCETPLLVLDPSRAEDRRPDQNQQEHQDEHLWYPVKLGPDGRPLLATTAVKGMLRSAYEAITNSRFGVFTGHDRRLRFRQPNSAPGTSGLHPKAPADLVLESDGLLPACCYDQLSPADRVFGWANQRGTGAWAGQIKISRVRCLQGQDVAVEYFREAVHSEAAPGLPLSILGEPKPQQTRFYLGDANGNAFRDHLELSQVSYGPGKRLRGRKFYPHHANLTSNYWNDPMRWRGKTQEGGAYQEYRRPPKNDQARGPEQQDSQNRTIQGWVKPQTEFDFDIDVENLSPVELGALLWLASMEEGHYLRLGLAKPYGFGSVRLAITGTQLRKGRRPSCATETTDPDWASWYEDLGAPEPEAETATSRHHALIERFLQAVVRVYPAAQFEEVSFIRAFLTSARGVAKLPVHYPRSTPEPRAKGENFRWFVANERIEERQYVRRYALPDLSSSNPGLPIQGQHQDRPRR
jgi:hypothetical protein